MSSTLTLDIVADAEWAVPMQNLVEASGHNARVFSPDHKATARDGELLFIAVSPSMLSSCIDGLSLQPRDHVVFVSPGLIPATGETATEYVSRQTACLRVGVLSGPLRSSALATGRMGAGVLASHFQSIQRLGAEVLHSSQFRVYPSSDVQGAQLAKPIVDALAFGVGLVDGLQVGETLRNILITRGVTQASHAAPILGAQNATMTGLCGLGSLLLALDTPADTHYAAGSTLGQTNALPTEDSDLMVIRELARSVEQILNRMGTESARFSLLEQLSGILSGETRLQDALVDLMERPVRQE